jgi:hypothetical protein
VEEVTDEIVTGTGMVGRMGSDETRREGFAGYIENARSPTTVAGLLPATYVVRWFVENGEYSLSRADCHGRGVW